MTTRSTATDDRAVSDPRSLAAAGASLTCFPTADPRRVRSEAGVFLWVPEGWDLLPPGDAMLTRRVRAGGPSWALVEKKGRRSFGRGVFAPAERIRAARGSVVETRADPAYEERLEAGRARRAGEQAAYVVEFAALVRALLRFAPAFAQEEATLAAVVAAHATPVGSGTVARTERIPVERRAEAAVIAWLRHRTTAYDHMRVERIRGERRRVRQALAAESRRLLDLHRGAATGAHPGGCPLCAALRTAAGEVERG